jgi:hypothetical protein
MWLSLCWSNQSSALFLFPVFFRVGFPLFPICREVVRFATSKTLLSGLSLNFIQVVSMEMFTVLMKRYLQSPILPCLPFFNSFIYILFQVCPIHWNMWLQTERVHHLSCCWCPSFSVYYVLTSNDSPLLNFLSDVCQKLSASGGEPDHVNANCTNSSIDVKLFGEFTV